MHSSNQSIRPLIQRKSAGSEFLVSQKSTSPTQRALPVGSRPTTSKLTGSSSGAQITRSIVRVFFAPFTFLLWWTRQRCHGLLVTALIGPVGGETLEAWGCAYNTSFYVVSTGVRINTLVPNNTKMARGGARGMVFRRKWRSFLIVTVGRLRAPIMPCPSFAKCRNTIRNRATLRDHPLPFLKRGDRSKHSHRRGTGCNLPHRISGFIRNYPFIRGCFVRRGFNCNIPSTEIWTHAILMILNIVIIN